MARIIEPRQLVTSTDLIELVDAWREKYPDETDLYERKYMRQQQKAEKNLRKFNRRTLAN